MGCRHSDSPAAILTLHTSAWMICGEPLEKSSGYQMYELEPSRSDRQRSPM